MGDIPVQFKIDGSAGQSRWTRCPCVAILDPLVTESAQDGYYLVYLFREDLSGFYLSLNQGVTDVREKYKSDAKNALLARAADFRARLPIGRGRLILDSIDLRPSSSSNYSAFYEAGNILSVFYDSAEQQNESTFVWTIAKCSPTYKPMWPRNGRKSPLKTYARSARLAIFNENFVSFWF